MTNKVTHTGIVDSIEGRHIRVRIVQQAACASCKVASRCNASDTTEKIVDVYQDSEKLRVGQPVVVSTSGDAVRHALLLGFGLPLMLLVGVLTGAKLDGNSDETAALLGLGSLIPYYIIVWHSRSRIAQRISFQLENE